MAMSAATRPALAAEDGPALPAGAQFAAPDAATVQSPMTMSASESSPMAAGASESAIASSSAAATASAPLRDGYTASGLNLAPHYLGGIGDLDISILGGFVNFPATEAGLAGGKLSFQARLLDGLGLLADLGHVAAVGLRGPLWADYGLSVGWDARFRTEVYFSATPGSGLGEPGLGLLPGFLPGGESRGVELALNGEYSWWQLRMYASPVVALATNRSGLGIAGGADVALGPVALGLGTAFNANLANHYPEVLIENFESRYSAGMRLFLNERAYLQANYLHSPADTYGIGSQTFLAGLGVRLFGTFSLPSPPPPVTVVAAPPAESVAALPVEEVASIPESKIAWKTSVTDGKAQGELDVPVDGILEAVRRATKTVRIAPEPETPVEDAAIKIPAAAVAEVAQRDLNLQVGALGVTLEVPPETIRALKEKGNDAVFRVEAVKSQRSMAQAQVAAASLGGGRALVGQPFEVHANYQGLTNVRLPIPPGTVPGDPGVRKRFEESLGVVVEHSDGDKEVIDPKIDFDKNGFPVAALFPLQKFSLLVLVSRLEFHLTVEAAPGQGKVNPEPGVHARKEKGPMTLTAEAAPGWKFVRWEGPVASPDSPRTTVLVDGDRSVRPIFVAEAPVPVAAPLSTVSIAAAPPIPTPNPEPAPAPEPPIVEPAAEPIVEPAPEVSAEPATVETAASALVAAAEDPGPFTAMVEAGPFAAVDAAGPFQAVAFAGPFDAGSLARGDFESSSSRRGGGGGGEENPISQEAAAGKLPKAAESANGGAAAASVASCCVLLMVLGTGGKTH
jgi:hypothetical protein